MQIEYNVDKTNIHKGGKWINLITTFANSENENIKMTFETNEEAVKAANSIYVALKRSNFNVVCFKRHLSVYLMKGE